MGGLPFFNVKIGRCFENFIYLRSMEFAEIILPLPLPGTFTYRLTADQQSIARPGLRAVVQFGLRHYYTGIILRLADQAPEGFDIKDVTSIEDVEPSVRGPQLKLWEWMAEYYLCALGDVMKAALPSGLKLESETTIGRNRDYEEDPDNRLTETELEVLSMLGDKPIRIGSIEKFSGKSNILPVLKRLMAKEAVWVDEDLEHKYKPKVRSCVSLNPKMLSPDGKLSSQQLNAIFAMMQRSKKQRDLFMKWLDMSRFIQKSQPNIVPQIDLQHAADCDSTVVKALVRKGIFETKTVKIPRIEIGESATLQPVIPLVELTEVQKVAYRQICNSFRDKDVSLLHGVTSSGKTEIYMHLAMDVISRGQQVLMMVPEIALTTQLCTRLRKVFGKRMAVYHSKFSDSERVETWQRILHNEPEVDLVLGVRSSIFLPFRQLGLIIVDEEHEPSYKQQDPAPRYNGRDAAMMLAGLHGAKVLLGSATPCLESYYQALEKKYGYIKLSERHAGVGLPAMRLISLTEARKNNQLHGLYTRELLNEIRHSLMDNHQVILFQNRRGFAPVVECPDCGWLPQCPRCAVSLTYHRSRNLLECHYCGYTMPWPPKCPICGNVKLQLQGYGTERIEEDLRGIVPIAKTTRMDTDVTTSKKSYERILDEFETQRANVLIGTQMVSKGLDFSGVDTVGIMNADSLMNFPDFRSEERAFQLMEQVAGRAGRRVGDEGKVLIQCSNPASPLLHQVVTHDYESMAKTQLQDRKLHGYPPFTRLIVIYMKGRYEDKLQQLAYEYAGKLRHVFGERIIGPDTPPVARVRNMFIYRIMLKMERAASPKMTRQYLLAVQQEMQRSKTDFARTVFYYDADPL